VQDDLVVLISFQRTGLCIMENALVFALIDKVTQHLFESMSAEMELSFS